MEMCCSEKGKNERLLFNIWLTSTYTCVVQVMLLYWREKKNQMYKSVSPIPTAIFYDNIRHGQLGSLEFSTSWLDAIGNDLTSLNTSSTFFAMARE